MIFKTLKINGFTSFAEPCTVEFDRLNYFFGDNGAGKTNFCKALFWVLGLEAEKFHREDKVIFSGSIVQKSKSKAEVILTIDNCDKSLNIDSNVVNIRRSVSRGEKSEFFINDKLSSPKAIKNLFGDFFISNFSSIYFDQSSIEEIGACEETLKKKLFEKILGIDFDIEKKEKLDKSLLNLEEKLENLKKDIDILGAKEKKLREEKDDYREYNYLKENIFEFKKNILLKNISKEEILLNARQKDLILVNIEYEKLTKEQNNFKVKKDNVFASFLELIETIDEKKEKLLNESREIEKISKEYGEKSKKIETFDYHIEYLGKKKERLFHLLDEEKAELKDINEELEEKLENLEKKQNHIYSLNSELNSNYKEEKLVASQLDEDRDKKNKIENNEKALISKIESLEKNKDNYKNKFKSIEEEVIELERKKEVLEIESNQLGKALIELRDKKRETFATFELSNRKHEEYLINLEDLTKKSLLKKENLLKLEEKIKLLKDIDELEETKGQIEKKVLKAEIDGVLGSVSDSIEIHKGMEKPLEAAFGEMLKGIIVKDEKSAKIVLRFLENNKYGKINILPLEQLECMSKDIPKDLEKNSNFIGKAIDFVECKEETKKAIESIIGNVIITRDFYSAKEFKEIEPNFIYVTLAGERIDISNAIFGGTYKNEDLGLFQNRTKVSLLEEKYNELEVDIKKLNLKIEKEKSKEEKLKERLELDRELDLETGNKLIKLKEQNTYLEKSFFDSRDRIRKWRNIAIELEYKIRESANLLIEKNSQLDGQKEEKINLENSISSLESTLKGIKSNIELIKKNLEKENLEIETLKGNINLNNKLIESLKKKIVDDQLDISAIEKETNLLEIEIPTLRLNTNELKNNEEHRKTLMKDLEKEVEILEREKNSGLKKEKSLAREIEKHDILMEGIIEKKYAYVEAYNISNTRLEELKRQLAEEYKIVFTEEIEKKNNFSIQNAVREIALMESKLKEFGNINNNSLKEYEESLEKKKLLEEEIYKAEKEILETKVKLEEILVKIKYAYRENFRDIASDFDNVFANIFGGGSARIKLLDENKPLESPMEIILKMPEKKLMYFSELGTGDKALVSIALIIVLFKIRKNNFFIFDGITSFFDKENLDRYSEFLKEITYKGNFQGFVTSNNFIDNMDSSKKIYLKDLSYSEIETINN